MSYDLAQTLTELHGLFDGDRTRMIARWIAECGGHIVYLKFAGFVPMFCSNWVARSMKLVEPLIEAVPGLNNIACSVVTIVARRQT